MTRKPSMFFAEKRILTAFPYWTVVAVLIVVTVMSFLPYKVSRTLLHSSMSKIVVKRLMSIRGLA
jgi:hypothetical protein